MRYRPTDNLLDAISFLLWLLAAAGLPVAGPQAPVFVYAYLWAGPLLIVPLAYGTEWPRRYGLPAATLFMLSFLIPNGWPAALLLLPWAALLSWWTIREWSRPDLPLFRRLAPAWLIIGLAWTLADRLGWRPMDFPPLIVLLTAIHFHYAGFALSWLAGRAGLAQSWWWVLVGSVAGVAVGITAVHRGHTGWWETVPVSMLVVVAWLTARQQWRLPGHWRQQWSWRLSSLALGWGMLLAGAYGWRFWWPLEWLTIPWMYAVHGSLNALGFALPGLLGWRLANTRSSFWDFDWSY
ncbi:MAG: YndJ family transporter [Lewinella sp.]|nr:YndJ family transporter [Lewinella sp.]